MSNWVQPAPYTFEFFYPRVNKKCWGQQAHLGKNTGTSMVNQFHDKCQLAMGSNFYRVLRKIRTWVIEKCWGETEATVLLQRNNILIVCGFDPPINGPCKHGEILCYQTASSLLFYI